MRILEGHPFERVGGSVPIRVDVRVVAATNQPLEQAIGEGRFRRDLFFRLQVIEIRVPSLEKARQILDYKPVFDLRQGLQLTADWYRENLEFFVKKPDQAYVTSGTR